jgi:subfamily B ATP-binding cassette protein MsbA
LEHLGDTNRTIQDTISGISVVKTYNLETYQYEKVNDNLLKSLQAGIASKKLYYSVLLPLFIVMNHLPRILCILLGGYLAIIGEITAGELFAFVQLLTYLVQPMKEFPNMIQQTYNFLSAGYRVASIFLIPKERTDGNYFQQNESQNIIEFRKVSLTYNESEDVLKNVSCTIKPGAFIGIVGPSGSGKSTILNLLSGFINPSSGGIYLYGKPIEIWNLTQLRSQFSYVSQDDFLFPGTIEENIKYGNPEATYSEVIEASKKAQAH